MPFISHIDTELHHVYQSFQLYGIHPVFHRLPAPHTNMCYSSVLSNEQVARNGRPFLPPAYPAVTAPQQRFRLIPPNAFLCSLQSVASWVYTGCSDSTARAPAPI